MVLLALLDQNPEDESVRADYWKSQPRKECEFCKCWIADNKPSIAFHENGKRHKENVAKRLSEISKKSAQDAKHKVQMDKDFKKMEEAALKAYMKDIEGNADFTSQLVLDGLQQKQKAAEEAVIQQTEAKKAKEAAKQREKIDLENKRKRVKEKAASIKWHEARSDDGYSYYWHIDNNETKWEAPTEGYISLAEQKILEEAEKAKLECKDFKKKSKNKPPHSNPKRKSSEASSSESKKRILEVKPSETSKKSVKEGVVMGPAPKPNPYGLWKPIEKKVEEQVDFQLPSQERVETKVINVTEDRPKIKFHEKKISRPIDDESGPSQSFSTTFKKKGNFRGNARQRLDTDD